MNSIVVPIQTIRQIIYIIHNWDLQSVAGIVFKKLHDKGFFISSVQILTSLYDQFIYIYIYIYKEREEEGGIDTEKERGRENIFSFKRIWLNRKTLGKHYAAS